MHKTRKRGEAVRKIRQAQFKTTATVCAKCGAALWDAELQARFMKWLRSKQKTSRTLFQLQPLLTQQSRDCLEKLKESYPASNDASIVRALVVLYLEVVLKSPELTDAVEGLTRTAQFDALRSGPTQKMSVTFNPAGLVAIDAWSELTGLAHAKVVEEALYRMLTVYLKATPAGKKLWEERFRESFNMILLAA